MVGGLGKRMAEAKTHTIRGSRTNIPVPFFTAPEDTARSRAALPITRCKECCSIGCHNQKAYILALYLDVDARIVSTTT